MTPTFGDRLLRFTLSVDQLDSINFNEIITIIENYLSKTLGIASTRIYLKKESKGRPYLKRFGIKGGFKEEGEALPIYDGPIADGLNPFQKRKQPIPYTSQTAYSCMETVPLWVVSSDKEDFLSRVSSDELQDLWSEHKELPPYRDTKHLDSYPSDYKGTKTSIYIPLRETQDRGPVIGVINFDTDRYIEITDIAKNELKNIAISISNLIDLLHAYEVSEKNKRNTSIVISQLKEMMTLPLPPLTMPQLFLATSSRADQEVIETIKKTLESAFCDRLKLIYWAEMKSPGNISMQVMKTIKACRYGICYFSEPAGEGEGYKDNFNVIFEAGMFQGRINPAVGEHTANWIPIREENSPDIPFDFAQERILMVPRKEKNQALDNEAFAKDLASAVAAMLTFSDD